MLETKKDMACFSSVKKRKRQANFELMTNYAVLFALQKNELAYMSKA